MNTVMSKWVAGLPIYSLPLLFGKPYITLWTKEILQNRLKRLRI